MSDTTLRNALQPERRLDIDLLRAIAVLAVILFHFGVPGFTGGFIGVDIFFVISGYLISRQIQSRIQSESFSYLEFLARRARRLVPAYAVTLIATAFLGVFMLTPDSHQHLLKELTFSAAYLSNFMFWQESGYFDVAAMTKPLLHTWSLAVEEQFYFIWPAVLLLLARGRAILWWPMLGLASLIACEVAIARDASAAFFLFPFRVFEFVIGAFASHLRIPRTPGVRAVFDLAALFGVVVPVFVLTERSHFPGISVLPACLGTAWIIAARPPWLNSRHLLSNIGSWIGKVSYSVYLIHWPLVVFYAQFHGEDFGALSTVFLLTVTFILSEQMWRFVERPFLESKTRVRAFLPAVPATFVVVFLITLAAPSVYEWVHADRRDLDTLVNSLEPRQEMTERLLAKAKEQRLAKTEGNQKTDTRIAVVGDSHAIDGGLALQVSAGTQIEVAIVHTVCDPLVNDLTEAEAIALYADHGNAQITPETCREGHRSLLQRIVAGQPHLVVFSERWRSQAIPYLGGTIQKIRQETGAAIVILGKNQEFQETPGRLLSHVSSVSQIRRAAWERRVDHSELDTSLRRVAEATGSVFIEKSHLVCPVKGSCDYFMADALTYSDKSHWTESGLEIFGKRLVEIIIREGLLPAAATDTDLETLT